jgi:IS30 family transposase
VDRAYRQLTFEERRVIFRLVQAKISIGGIADRLGRHRSTIYREIGRNEFREVKLYRGYYPVTAHDSARQRRQRQRKLIRDACLREQVLARLALGWSPEQIAGRLRHADDRRLCHETIYQFVYGPEGRALELHRHLLRARRQRRRRFGRKPLSRKIPVERSITHRPTSIARREQIGHWEGDLLIFRQAHGRANLTSLVERKSRLIRLVRNSDRRSAGVVGAIGEALADLPAEARRSITFDRGSEFLAYDHLASQHGIVTWFCDPHAPWQKGSIENVNGRLRRFLPGEINIAALTPAELNEVETRMNSTPRKCLGFMTPAEAFAVAAGQPAAASHLSHFG